MDARPVRREDGTEYPSIMDAAKAIVEEQGFSRAITVAHNISNCIHGRHKTAYSYTWEFVENNVCPTCGRPWKEQQ